MRNWKTRSAAVLVAALLLAPTAARTDELANQTRLIFDVVRERMVQVDFELEYEARGERHSMRGSASGVVVREDGLVMLTAYAFLRGGGLGHLTSGGPQTLKIKFLDDTKYEGAYIGSDDKLNLAFVKINAPAEKKFPIIEFIPGLSLEVGDRVIVCDLLPDELGSRLKAETCRISSVLEKPARVYTIHPSAMEALGAPVFNAAGQAVGVIGISSAFGPRATRWVTGRSTAAFMPAASFAALIQDPPKRTEVAKKGWLGVSVRQALTPELAKYWGLEGQKGVIISHVYKGYPADKAGLKDEDIIVKFANEPVEVANDQEVDFFTSRVATIPPGTKVPVAVFRKEADAYVARTFEVTLAEAPRDRFHADKFEDKEFGLTVRETTFDSVDDPEDPKSFLGVIVDKVEAAGWAGLGGIRPRDRILKIGQDAVKDLADFKQLLEKARQEKKKEVVFFIRRGASTNYIRADTDWK